MRAADLRRRRVAIWGLGREGRAAIRLLRRHRPDQPLFLFDDVEEPKLAQEIGGPIEAFFGKEAILRALPRVEVIVKSPGVSLYRPEIEAAHERGIVVTSLLNLWFAEPRAATRIGVTGTKGKSTTASLLAHLLRAQGKSVALAGNIGVAIGEGDIENAEFVVIEVSSYQAADFDGMAEVALLTALFPEHLDWHGSTENYYRDKLRLLERARCRILPACALAEASRFLSPAPGATRLFETQSAIHAEGGAIFNGKRKIGDIANPYLRRRHNASNLSAALTAFELLGGDLAQGLAASADFTGLPHRQKELGLVEGILAVDDSISTTPESALAALEAYAGRDITLILGGQDRGIDYGKLVTALLHGAARRAICIGEAGKRICAEAALADRRQESAFLLEVPSMAKAVERALALTPKGGVILLSPAAPSYGQYRNFIERGRDFAARIGLPET